MAFEEWNTPGWTSQNPYIPVYEDTTYPEPPVGMTVLPVDCTYLAAGGGQSGYLHFTPSVPYVNAGDTQVSLVTVNAQVKAGHLPVNFSLLQPDTNLNTVEPATWTWHVSGRVGKDTVSVDIPVPYVGTFNLTALIN